MTTAKFYAISSAAERDKRSLSLRLSHYHLRIHTQRVRSHSCYSMDDSEKLLAIKQELERINERLGELFPSNHPQFDDVFEDLGAASYYIREAGHCIQAAIKTVLRGADNEVG